MKFEQYVGGMVELRLPAQRTEEILQQLTAAGVHLHQIKRHEEFLYLWIHLDDFEILQHLLRQQRCPFHVQRRQGIPFAVSAVKRRKGLWLGGFFSLALLYLLFSFLWSYEVSGNVQYSDAHMIALVQEYGVLPGSRIDKFDYDALEQQIILEHPEFVWVQLQPNGTTLEITVKERLSDEKTERQQGSIVAESDGKITELLVFRGTPLIKQGDWVKKGQVLIGGWDYPDRQRDSSGSFAPAGEPFAVRAKGVIRGEKEQRAIGSCALEERILQSTGNEKKQYALVWQGHQVIIWGPKESPYQYSYQHTERHSLLQWQQFYLPVYIKTTVFEEKTLQQRTYTREEAYLVALERARKRLQEQLPADSQVIRESSGIYEAGQEHVVQAEVVWTVEGNLAQVLQAQVPQAETSTEMEEDAVNQQEATGG